MSTSPETRTVTATSVEWRELKKHIENALDMSPLVPFTGKMEEMKEAAYMARRLSAHQAYALLTTLLNRP